MQELGHELAPLEEVRETILSLLPALSPERTPLAEAHGRILREPLVARDLLPPFDNSAMDGYAVRVSDLERASTGAPVTLSVAGRIQAGSGSGAPLRPATTVRIMTGAPLPPGAEAVVPHELTESSGSTVTFRRPVRSGENVRSAGGDIRPGEIPLEAGCELRSPQLALAAALGYAEVEVSRRPRVGVLSPGDELVDVSEMPGPGKIRNSNAYSIRGALIETGAVPVDLGIARDTPEAILAALARGADAGLDAFVTTGGVSAGDFDFVQAVVREHGRPGHVFKVAMRPGKPQVFGLIDGRPLFGLPGNPAAAIISFEVFVRPALRAMCGAARALPELFGARFPFAYTYKPGRVFLLRARLEPRIEGGFEVAEPGPQDSSFLGSLARANAIVVLPAEGGPVRPGDVHPAFWLGSYAP